MEIVEDGSACQSAQYSEKGILIVRFECQCEAEKWLLSAPQIKQQDWLDGVDIVMANAKKPIGRFCGVTPCQCVIDWFEFNIQCYYHLRYLWHMHKFQTVNTAVLLANTVVSSRLDYCMSLIYGIKRASVAKFQKVQNVLCCIVSILDRMNSCHILSRKTPLASHFILYPFQYSLLTFKAVNPPPHPPLYLPSLIKSSIVT